MVMPTVKKPKPGIKGSVIKQSGRNLPLLLLAACLTLGAGFLITGTPSSHTWLRSSSIANWAFSNGRQGVGDTSHVQSGDTSTAPPQPVAQRKLQQDTEGVEFVRVEAEELKKAAEALRRELTDEVVEAEAAACRLTGKVADCGCDFASVERLNRLYVHPTLSQLITQPFFRYFKVNLYCDCQFWPDAGMCFQRDCCVSECDREHIPDSWRKYDEALAALKRYHSVECQGEAGVDRSMDEEVEHLLASVPNWHLLNNPWVPEDDQGVDYIYVDLTKNTEKYTGYKGEDARRIWAAIYQQAAIKEGAGSKEGDDVTQEQRVLYRLISGMHASITMSIITNYYNETTGEWGANLPFFKARFASPAARPHVENLYFTFLFVLRAVTKAAEAIKELDFSTGWNDEACDTTLRLMNQMLNSPKLKGACPIPFDEGLLWRHDPQHSEELRQQLQVTFINITHLMDCVGCEKCKMHGKLNMLGIATALKVLFSQDKRPVETGSLEYPVQLTEDPQPSRLQLDRNEIIALINFFAKLSDSVEGIRSLSTRLALQEAALQDAGAAGAQ